MSRQVGRIACVRVACCLCIVRCGVIRPPSRAQCCGGESEEEHARGKCMKKQVRGDVAAAVLVINPLESSVPSCRKGSNKHPSTVLGSIMPLIVNAHAPSCSFAACSCANEGAVRGRGDEMTSMQIRSRFNRLQTRASARETTERRGRPIQGTSCDT